MEENAGGWAKSEAAATEPRNLEAKAGKAEFPQVHVRTFCERFGRVIYCT